MAHALVKRLGILKKQIGCLGGLKQLGCTGHYSTSPSLTEIGNILRTMAGPGSIDLMKDEQTGIATIIINNTTKRNALNGKMMVDLHKCVEELSSWQSGRGVILTGAGRTFCSGGDLETVSKIITDDKLGNYMCQYMQAVTTRLFNLPLISVAAIDGHALGGGAELCTACDFRIMSETSRLGFVQVRFNILTGWGGGTRLVQLVGPTKALQLLSSGKVLNAKTAQDIGLANAVIHVQKGRSDFLEQSKHWLLENCHGDVKTTHSIKQLVRGAVDLPTEEALDNERKLFCDVWGKEAHIAALSKNVKHNN